MGVRTQWALRIISASLMMLAIVNLGNVASQFEMHVAMKFVYVSCVSWAVIWLAGLVLVILSFDDRPHHH